VIVLENQWSVESNNTLKLRARENCGQRYLECSQESVLNVSHLPHSCDLVDVDFLIEQGKGDNDLGLFELILCEMDLVLGFKHKLQHLIPFWALTFGNVSPLNLILIRFIRVVNSYFKECLDLL